MDKQYQPHYHHRALNAHGDKKIAHGKIDTFTQTHLHAKFQ